MEFYMVFKYTLFYYRHSKTKSLNHKCYLLFLFLKNKNDIERKVIHFHGILKSQRYKRFRYKVSPLEITVRIVCPLEITVRIVRKGV